MVDFSQMPALALVELRGGYMDKMAENLARELAAKKDAIVGYAVSMFLGTEHWELQSLKGRLGIVMDDRDKSETYTVDGVGVVKFYPCEINNLSTRNENHVICAFNYRFLK